MFLKRGERWRENITFAYSGTAGSPIVIDAYGTGAKPLLLGSTNSASWTTNGGNVWKTAAFASGQYVGNLIFNGRTFCGVREDTLSSLTAQGQYYYNRTDRKVYLYSATIPSTYYTDIECCLDILPNGSNCNDLIDIVDQNYITIRNIDMQCAATLGIMVRGTSSHITVENCNFKWIGGSLWNGARQGDSFSLYVSTQTSTDITVRYNTMSQCFDGGPNIQITSTGTIRRVYFHHNVIDSTNFGIYCYSNVAGATIDSVFWDNNTMVNQGRGWSTSQRLPLGDSLISGGISFPFSLLGTVTHFYIRNNVVYNPYWSATAPADWKKRESALCFSYNNTAVNDSLMTISYNRYYVPTGNMVFYRAYGTPIDGNNYLRGVYTSAQFATWKSDHGHDAGSTVGDPIFMSSTDFRLAVSSPCVNAGANLGYTQDILGNPIVGVPDIGAYESQRVKVYIPFVVK